MIEIKDLAFLYEKTPALDHVNLSISPGEFIGVFGPNGGGKTTFLKLLLGFLKPSRGTLHVSTKHIGYVPQVLRFDKQFPISVFELVLMGELSKASWLGTFPANLKEKARKALDRVGLLDKRDHPFGSLSGGQAQRALIARALVDDPELLLLDEPTSCIDKKGEMDITDLLKELKGKMTILMVTHHLETILPLVDRLLCVHRKITPLSPQEVCAHYSFGLYGIHH